MGLCFQSYLEDLGIEHEHQSKEYEEYFLASPCLPGVCWQTMLVINQHKVEEREIWG